MASTNTIEAEYIGVHDITNNILIDTALPDVLRQNNTQRDRPFNAALLKQAKISDTLRISNTTIQHYCPRYPVDIYYGSCPWHGTAYHIHMVGFNKLQSCTHKVVENNTVYVVLTTSCSKPIHTFTELMVNLNPLYNNGMKNVVDSINRCTNGHGTSLIRKWLGTLVAEAQPTPHVPTGHMLPDSKKIILVTSSVIMVLVTLYLISIFFLTSV